MDLRDTATTQHDPLTKAAVETTATTNQKGPKQPVKEALKEISFGSVAGIGGKFVEFPFDTVKVRLQSQPDHLPLRYTGPLDCFKQSLRQDGFRGLYRGISAPLVGAALETSSLFVSYRVAKNIARATFLPGVDPLPLPVLVTCGAISGAFTSLLLTPIELIKCKMQVPLETTSSRIMQPGPLTLIASIYRHQGLRGFWHGQLGTLIRETGGSAAWFGSFEAMSTVFRRAQKPQKGQTDETDQIGKPPRLPLYQEMFAGALAGMSYNFIFYPADTIKSRMQTEEVGALSRGTRTFWTVGRELWAQHGIRGMYRGCGITVGRAAPSSALIFSIYEGLKREFG